MAERLTGSSDLYEATGRRPFASINFVTCHDGFTLGDLMSYDHKHNEANGEDGRDGTDDNRSWNCGAEGPTDDPEILALRHRQVRNLLATLFLSQGVPMMLGGDELGRSQLGNNNAYCQDSPISWYDWAAVDRDLLAWTQRLIALRRAHPIFRRRRFFQGLPLRGSGSPDHLPDIGWFRPDGATMTDADWEVGYAKSLGVFLNGKAIRDPDIHGRPIVDDSFYLIFNGWEEEIDFTLPETRWAAWWDLVLDTAAGTEDAAGAPSARRPAEGTLRVSGYRLLLLQSAVTPNGST